MVSIWQALSNRNAELRTTEDADLEATHQYH